MLSEKKDLQKQIDTLFKKIKCSTQILYSEAPLSGTVPDCYVFGIDTSTGKLYYKNIAGNWAFITP